MNSGLPSFLGLGTQRGGTTTLHHLLAQHPQVFLPHTKELHYFTLHYGRGEAWYRSQFAAAGPHQCLGEITPYYLFHPQAPARIQALLPQARLVVLLRDPVERALSGYFHSVRLGVEPLAPAEAFAAEAERLQGAEQALQLPTGVHAAHQLHSYLSRSVYGPQLERLERQFGPEQQLVLRSEDLFAQPQQVWPRLLAFLGLDPHDLPEEAHRSRHNAGQGEGERVPAALRQQLREQLDRTYIQMAERYGLVW